MNEIIVSGQMPVLALRGLVVFPKKTGGSYTIVSSDPSVATVDGNGVVTALQSGAVTITVTTFNNKTATAKLTVSSQPSAADVSLPTNEYSSITSTTSAIGDNANNAEKLEYVIFCAQSQLGKPYTTGNTFSAGLRMTGLQKRKLQINGTKSRRTGDNVSL